MSFRKAGKEDENDIIAYFETDLKNCLYSYIDLKKYGFENKNLEFYLNCDGAVKTVATRYYNGITIFHNPQAAGSFCVEDAVAILQKLSPDMINGRTDIIAALEPAFHNQYYREDGFVTELIKSPDEIKNTGSIVSAMEEDYTEIAELICSDEGLGGQYKVEDLKNQLLERKREAFGRNYIWKEDGKIICHAATYAELSNLAVVSGVITREGYRGRRLAYQVVSKLCSDLTKEGKREFLFYFTREAGRLYHKIGFEEGTSWSKLARRLIN